MLDPFWQEDEAALPDLELRAPAPDGDSPFAKDFSSRLDAMSAAGAAS